MTKGIIYYTDNKLGEPIFSIVQKQILNSNLPIVSVSLSPINFGKNFVLDLPPGYIAMISQITKALEEIHTDYVFFCEHDVLYPVSHFYFTPPRDDIFYYNASVWRWDYPNDRAINYDRLISLSGLCANRKLTLDHYKRRLMEIKKNNYQTNGRREPYWARNWGYEPGTKKKVRGGFSDEDFDTWKSEFPIIDIRHKGTYSPPKTTLGGFKHLPTNWKEITLDKIPGWNLKKIFNIK